MDWVCSDLHFFHRRIVEFTDRGIETTADKHTEWLINLWNSTVAKSDRVFHLGDFSFAKNWRDTVSILERLNGQKFFIKGNHDSNKDWKEIVKVSGTGLSWFRDYFEDDFVIQGQKQRICMFHFPMVTWHKQHYGSWHLHGHCHGNLLPDFSRGKMLDVGLDNSHMMYGKHCFYNLEMIKKYMDSRELVIADQHRAKQHTQGELR